MKLGAESRNKTIGAAVLALFAVFLFWRSFFVSGPAIQSRPPAPAQVGPAANPGATPPTTAGRHRGNQVAGVAVNPLDPRLRLDLLKASQDMEYAGSGRNIFLAQAEPDIPKPIEPVVTTHKTDNPPVPVTPPHPTTPPLPFQAFGVATGPGLRKVMLVEGDDVFVAKEGQVIKGQYKIVKINPNSVEIQDLLTNNTQTIPIAAS